jgi:hypothetical protein
MAATDVCLLRNSRLNAGAGNGGPLARVLASRPVKKLSAPTGAGLADPGVVG